MGSQQLAPTDWVSGLLSGFTSRKADIEAQNLREGEIAREREARIYQTLISSPDPEIQAAAMTGLFESARPGRRKGGIRGWLGEIEANPAYAQIQELMRTPTTGVETTYQPGQVPVPGETSLALPATSPTEVGAPPPTMPQATPGSPGDITAQAPAAMTPLPQMVVEPGAETAGPEKAFRPTAVQKTVKKARRVFPTPQDLAAQQAAGQYGGRVEGVLTAMRNAGVNVTPEIAQQVALELSGYSSSGGVGSSPFQSIAGEVVRPDGSTVSAFGVFDRATGGYVDPITKEPLQGFRPRQVASRHTLGMYYERAARMAGYNAGADVPVGAEADRVNGIAQGLLEEDRRRGAYGTEVGQYQAPIDAPTAQRTGTTIGASAQQYEGQRIGTQQQQQRRIAAGDIKNQLQHITTLLPSVLPRRGDVVGGLVPGGVIAARRQMPQYREAFAALDSAINNIRAALTRTMQANVGTETEKDAERAITTLVAIQGRLLNPTQGDTVESANARIAETLRYLDEVTSSLPGAPVLNGPPVGVGAPPPGPGAVPQAGAPPPAPAAAPAAGGGSAGGPAGLFVGADGELHVGSPTGPLFK